MAHQQNKRSCVCPNCGQRRLLDGGTAKANPRSKVSGKIICAECLVEEIKDRFISERVGNG